MELSKILLCMQQFAISHKSALDALAWVELMLQTGKQEATYQ